MEENSYESIDKHQNEKPVDTNKMPNLQFITDFIGKLETGINSEEEKKVEKPAEIIEIKDKNETNPSDDLTSESDRSSNYMVIDKLIYGPQVSEVSDKYPNCGLGQLKLTISYCQKTSRLSITVHEAKYFFKFFLLLIIFKNFILKESDKC